MGRVSVISSDLGMDGAKGLVKQLVLLKFKDDTPMEKIKQLIKGYTNFVTLIDPLKEFHWYLSFSHCVLIYIFNFNLIYLF